MSKCNIQNRTVFCRDNLEVLGGINSNCIDLIYLDPPFNKKQVFTAPIGSHAEGAGFSDIFRQEDIKEEWLQRIKEDQEKLHIFLESVKAIEGRTSYNFCYLSYMAIRLMECHRVLKEAGSLYLHCDDTMSHYLKILLDILFGSSGFRNEIVWKRMGIHSDAKKYGRVSDRILFFTKSENYFFDRKKALIDVDEEELLKRFNRKDDLGRYRIDRLDARGLSGGGYEYEYKGVKDLWRCSREKMSGFERDGLMYWSDQAGKPGRPYKKTYLEGGKYQKRIQDIWFNIKIQKKERTGYPTQKPLALLKRIIQASCPKWGMVLDPFCGCATTCVAAEGLEREWIGIDTSIKAYELVKKG